ncbi:hypothetical protein BKK48_08150 [Rodentibacter heidelbergensis]|uniref:Uncharacterized protein n=1 Tax=Rodentibacter heidelbergensis TaxID=1908258 RepID=A0A1V3I7A9_9PAST|nr:hypothetical protein BKK48_08150 [Rodentibacter heidelbergensis]
MSINSHIEKMLKESDKKGIEGVSVFENDVPSALQSLAIQHLAGKLNHDHPKKNKRRHHQSRLLSA